MAKGTFLNLPDVTCIQETEARKQNSHHSLNTRKHRKARNDKGKKSNSTSLRNERKRKPDNYSRRRETEALTFLRNFKCKAVNFQEKNHAFEYTSPHACMLCMSLAYVHLHEINGPWK